MIRIGCACVNTQLLSPNRTCRLSHTTPERIVQLARENLAALETILHQWKGKPPGSHSQSVDIRAFEKFYDVIADLEIDVVLEMKDKERSVLNVYRAIPQLKHNHAHGKKRNRKSPTD